jgi:hypothetical protein
MGQLAVEPLILLLLLWTSSGMEMSMTPWPPVWEPEMPSRP